MAGDDVVFEGGEFGPQWELLPKYRVGDDCGEEANGYARYGGGKNVATQVYALFGPEVCGCGC